MSTIDIRKCENLAEELLKKYEINEPVVNIFEIARGEGFELKFIKMPEELKNMAGFLDNDKKIIFINNNDPAYRQTFTIAHELGHFKLRHNTLNYSLLSRLSPINGDYTNEEKEANCFAANILVPKNMLKNMMVKYKITKDDAFLLAKMFGVSKQMIIHRLQDSNS